MFEQLKGTMIADKYRVDDLLRKGSLGDFYRGRHLFMDKAVLLKLLSPDLSVDDNIRGEFAAAAKASSAVSHPNILAVSDFGTGPEGFSYVIFEGFDGELLSTSIGRGGRFAVDRAVSVARQAADALSAAEEAGYMHGRLTPDSILAAFSDTSETVKVFDFDAAGSDLRQRAHDRSAESVTYLAPEQFSGIADIDGRSDIYSLGIILYQMLAGEAPFRGETPTDVMLKHAEEPPPSLRSLYPEIPVTLDAAVSKALAKDPNERYQTAAEFVTDLDKVAADADAPPKNNIWKTAFLALAGIAVLAAAMIYATSVKQVQPTTTTQLQPDANGVPVQPINPATGIDEQALAAMPIGVAGNSNTLTRPSTLPGGDNYNPWATGVPPAGAPPYIPPGGQTYTIDPNTGSPFMPPDGGVILVPVPANTNTAAKPSSTPKNAADAKTQKPATPDAATPKSTPVPAAASTPKASPRKKPAKPAGEDQPPGLEQNV